MATCCLKTKHSLPPSRQHKTGAISALKSTCWVPPNSRSTGAVKSHMTSRTLFLLPPIEKRSGHMDVDIHLRYARPTEIRGASRSVMSICTLPRP